MKKISLFPFIISAAAVFVAVISCILGIMIVTQNLVAGILILLFSVILLGANVYILLQYKKLKADLPSDNIEVIQAKDTVLTAENETSIENGTATYIDSEQVVEENIVENAIEIPAYIEATDEENL